MEKAKKVLKKKRSLKFVFDARSMEHPSGASMTRPGQAYSVQQLYDRAMNGLLNDLKRDTFGFPEGEPTHDSPDIMKLTRAELLDKAEYLRNNAERIEAQRGRVQKYMDTVNAKRKEEADLLKEVTAELRERKRAKEASTSNDKPQEPK